MTRTLRQIVRSSVFILLSLGMGYAAPLELRRGVNLEGWLELVPFRPITAEQTAQLETIKKSGFDFVRLMVNPAFVIEARPGAPEPQASLERVLKAAQKQNLKVVVSFYDLSDAKAQVLKGGTARDTYLVLVEKFARLLEQYSSSVVFEPIDQPVDPENWNCAPSSFDWNKVQGQFMAAARRGAPRLTLMATGLCYSEGDALTQIRPLEDKNVLYSFQYLEPLIFTQQGNPGNLEWNVLKGIPYPANAAQLKTSSPGLLAKISDPKLRQKVKAALEGYAGSGFAEADVRMALGRVSGWARQNNVSVLLKSFTVHSSAPRKDRLRWFRDVRLNAERQKLAWSVWTWQSPFGYGILEGGKLSAEVKAALGL